MAALREFIEYQEGKNHEKSKNFNKQYIKEQHEEGWMRRVPDFLSVCMQDFLYRRVTRAARTQIANRAGDDNKQVTPTILGIVGVLYVIIEILTGLARIT